MSEPEILKILIPLDGSPTGDSILTALFPLIRAQKVETTLMRVVESPEAGEEAARHLELRRKSLESQGVTARAALSRGQPAGEILRHAAQGDCDLIAMGTHGRSGLQRVLMGSVAEEVLRASPAPVLLCRADTRIGGWERIVVALDGTPASEQILKDVVRLARSLGAAVHLLRVSLPLLTIDGYRGVGSHVLAANPLPYLNQVAEKLAAQGITVVAEKREGMPGVEIRHVAEEIDAGLICMTTEGRPEQAPGLDRSVAAEVIHTAPCPVYIRPMTASVGARAAGTKKPAGAR